MKKIVLSNVIIIVFLLIFNEILAFKLEQAIVNIATDHPHHVQIRSLFNQIKSFAKELIESNDDTSIGHLLVEHIENCRFNCENDVEPIQNTAYNRTFNGCGAYNIHVDFDTLNMTGITECCNDHDLCYDTCRSKKDACDQIFEDCLLGQCVSMSNDPDKRYSEFPKLCNSAAKLMFETVRLFGCVAFERSQTNSCLCNIEEDELIEEDDKEAK